MDTRIRVIRAVLIVPLVVGALAAGTLRPAAAAYTCDGGTVPAVIKDNVVVPDNGQCRLTGTVVRGGVTIGAGAMVDISGAEIRGGITATNSPRFLQVADSVVRGSMTVTGTDIREFAVARTEIRGDLILTNSVISDNPKFSEVTVRGSMILRGNTTRTPIPVGFSAIDGNLVCENNNWPVDVGNTTVGGTASADCQFRV